MPAAAGPGPRLGAVVVDYFRTTEASELARRLATDEAFASVVVVSNGSRDEELRRAREALAGLPVEVVSLPNPGYGAAVNHGAELLRGRVDHLLVLTHEVRIDPSSAVALSGALAADPRVGLVGPLLLESPSGPVWSAGGTRTRVRTLPQHRDQGSRQEEVVGRARPAEWLDGAAFMVRLDDFLALGGVDDRFFLYLEDVELGSRYRRAGAEVVCLTTVSAEQASSGALDHFLATRNVLWLLRLERRRGRAALWVLETCGRLVLGRLRAGDPERHSQRLRGLRQGLGPIRRSARRA